MSVNTFFDHIYCLNLDRRPDRWERSQQVFAHFGITDVERFSATDGETMERFSGLTLGQVGVIDSHRCILADALQNEYNKILIFEDDIELTDNFHEVFEATEQELPSEWKMLYLGSNTEIAAPEQYSQHLYLANGVVALHALGFGNQALMRFLIQQIDYQQGPLDMMYRQWHLSDSFAVFPRIAYQRPGWSDINSTYVNYDF